MVKLRANLTRRPSSAEDIHHNRHCVFLLHAHLVFVTKFRRRCTSARVLEHMRSVFAVACKQHGAHLKECDGEGDHVHLLVDYPPKLSISSLVNFLKGASAHNLRKAEYPEIADKLWGDNLWSPSYFASSCGGAPLDAIKLYIQQQDSPPTLSTSSTP